MKAYMYIHRCRSRFIGFSVCLVLLYLIIWKRRLACSYVNTWCLNVTCREREPRAKHATIGLCESSFWLVNDSVKCIIECLNTRPILDVSENYKVLQSDRKSILIHVCSTTTAWDELKELKNAKKSWWTNKSRNLQVATFTVAWDKSSKTSRHRN